VYTDNQHVATFYVDSAERGDVLDVRYHHLSVEELLWTRAAALRLLHGGSISEVLGRSIALSRFTRKPAWCPFPGLVDVRALVPYENPRALPAMEVLRLVVGS
jgi:hypothetical protein